ncbi:Uncharacterised protein [Klebsiella pneumoniae]|nr:Uncharacterised protein [Klebsiella pneumoniae]
MVDIHLLVQFGDNVVVELGREGVERLFQAGVGLQRVLTDHRGDGIAREEAFIIFQHLEVEALHAPVGGINQPGVDEAVAHRVIDQTRVHLADLRAVQVHLIGGLKRLHAVAAPGKFQV